MSANSNDDVSRDDKVTLFNRNKDMSDVLYAQGLLKSGFPERRYGSVKSLLYEAHRYVSRKVKKEFTIRRARSIWEGTARRIDSEEMDALRLAVIEEEYREQQEIRARLAALDARLASIDEDFFSSALASVGSQESGLGRVHHDRKDRG